MVNIDDIIMDVRKFYDSVDASTSIENINIILKKLEDIILMKKRIFSLCTIPNEDSVINDNRSDKELDDEIQKSLFQLGVFDVESLEWYKLYFKLSSLYSQKFKNENNLEALLKNMIDYSINYSKYLRKFKSNDSNLQVELSLYESLKNDCETILKKLYYEQDIDLIGESKNEGSIGEFPLQVFLNPEMSLSKKDSNTSLSVGVDDQSLNDSSDSNEVDKYIEDLTLKLAECGEESKEWYELLFELYDFYALRYEKESNKIDYLKIKIDYYTKKCEYLKKYEHSASDFDVKFSRANNALNKYKKELTLLISSDPMEQAINDFVKDNPSVVQNDSLDPMEQAINDFIKDNQSVVQDDSLDPMEQAINEFISDNPEVVNSSTSARIIDINTNVQRVNSFNPFKKRRIAKKKKRKITEQENIATMTRVRKKLSEIFENMSKKISPISEDFENGKRR